MRLLYVIADIHGRLDLLRSAWDVIDAHRGGREGRVVTLGDYIDRGPDSAGVIAFLRRAEAKGGLLCLKGNHEDMMVKALRTGASDHWLRNGGQATLASYGGAAMDDDAAWMSTLPVHHTDGRRIFVHGGLEPGVPLEAQDEHTCLWIRDRFLAHEAAGFERHVVHGHTPVWAEKPELDKPELLPHRTNLDTGAWRTGVLTLGVFDDDAEGGPLEVLPIRGPAPPRPVPEPD